jgi:hypothetical protein
LWKLVCICASYISQVFSNILVITTKRSKMHHLFIIIYKYSFVVIYFLYAATAGASDVAADGASDVAADGASDVAADGASDVAADGAGFGAADCAGFGAADGAGFGTGLGPFPDDADWGCLEADWEFVCDDLRFESWLTGRLGGADLPGAADAGFGDDEEFAGPEFTLDLEPCWFAEVTAGGFLAGGGGALPFWAIANDAKQQTVIVIKTKEIFL